MGSSNVVSGNFYGKCYVVERYFNEEYQVEKGTSMGSIKYLEGTSMGSVR